MIYAVAWVLMFRYVAKHQSSFHKMCFVSQRRYIWNDPVAPGWFNP